MLDMNKVFDFFIESNEKSDGNLEMLKELYFKTDSLLIRDSVLITLYEYIMGMRYTLKDIINKKELLLFLGDYKGIELYREKHATELNKLKKFIFNDNFNFVSNKDELLPYIIIESLVEYNNAKVYFVPSLKEVEGNKRSTFIHNETLSGKNQSDFISMIPKLKNGYHLYKTNALKKSRYFLGTKYNVVSIQNNGFYNYDLNADVKYQHGVTRQRLNVTTHLIEKRHPIDFEYEKNDSTDISLLKKKKEFVSVLNEIIYRSFIYWCDFYAPEIKDTKLIAFKKHSEKNINLPAIITNNIIEMPVFTFDDLKFKGDFEHLSFLDDLFEDILDLNYVNIYNSDTNIINDYYHISKKPKPSIGSLLNLSTEEIEKSYDDHEKSIPKYKFTKEYFNNILTREINLFDAWEKSKHLIGFNLDEINPNFIGTSKEIREYAFYLSKTNKIKMYTLYLDMFIKDNNDMFEKELTEFFFKNASELLVDDEFYSKIKRIGFSKISFSSYNEIISRGNTQTFSLLNKGVTDCSNPSNFKNSFLDYFSGNKAHNFFLFDIKNVEILELLKTKYKLKLSPESEVFFNIFTSLNIIKNDKESKGIHTDSIYSTLDSDFAPEYFGFLSINNLNRVTVPLNNKNFNMVMNKVDSFEDIEKVDCKYGLRGILNF